jgi:Domain of unknown function (DUF4160)
MLEIKRFVRFKVMIFFQDENPPHVHIKGIDFAAKIRISNGDLLAGDAPNRVLKQTRRWLEENRADLLAMWDEFQR